MFQSNSRLLLVVLICCILLQVLLSSELKNDSLVHAAQVEFYPCDLFTEYDPTQNSNRRIVPTQDFFKSNGRSTQDVNRIRTDAECAIIPLTMNPDESENVATRKINIFVKRMRAVPSNDAKKVLWLIQGGPGHSSKPFEPIVNSLLNILSNQFDIYMMEHRGVGRSTRASCVASQAETNTSPGRFLIVDEEWKNCHDSFQSEWGTEETQFLSSKAAGIDLAKLIQMINTPKNQDTFTLGVSYGTIVLTRMMRYLELNELQHIVKGVILDGAVSTKGEFKYGSMLTLDLFDVNFNTAGHLFMELCTKYADKDDTCKKNLEKYVDFSKETPSEFMNAVLKRVYQVPMNESSCQAVRQFLSESQIKTMFGTLVMNDNSRVFVPALLYRLNRCDAKMDIEIISNFVKIFSSITDQKVTQLPLDSAITTNHIVLSEIWNPSTTSSSLQEQSVQFVPLIGSKQFMKVKEETNWRTYQLDPLYFNHTFTTSSNCPVLILNGDLDTQTPLWSAVNQANNIEGNSNGGLVVVPYAPHGTIFYSPQTGSSYSCGMELLSNFLSMSIPNVQSMDKSCLDRLVFSFGGEPNFNKAIFGVADIYNGFIENPPKPPPTPSPSGNVIVKEEMIELYIFVTTVSVMGFVLLLAMIVIIGIALMFAKQWIKSRQYQSLSDGNNYKLTSL